MKVQELATEWIKAQKVERDEKRLTNPTAIDAVIDLSTDDPEALWILILEIFSRDDIDDVIDSLGAGPLEDLIAENGEEFIERIKAELINNTKLASVLKFVWISEDIKPSVNEYSDLGCQIVSAKAT